MKKFILSIAMLAVNNLLCMEENMDVEKMIMHLPSQPYINNILLTTIPDLTVDFIRSTQIDGKLADKKLDCHRLKKKVGKCLAMYYRSQVNDFLNTRYGRGQNNTALSSFVSRYDSQIVNALRSDPETRCTYFKE